jgi:DNA-binding NarL/FixJ family response regulator
MVKVGGQSADSTNMESSTVQSAAADGIIGGRAALTALIVDDEAHVRSYVRVVLHSLGVTAVREAADGLEALRLYREKQPSVVFLDVNMPMMSGEKALAKLMEIDPDAAVVIVTSHNEIGTVRRFQELGAVGYVLKHARRQEFTETLEDLLDGLVAYQADE